MHDIKLVSHQQFTGTSEELKNKLEEKALMYHSATTYANSEAALLWIIRGCIDYFDKLDPLFLGEGNASGIPNMEADHFANNMYRLDKAIKYLARLWKLELERTAALNLLLDIRTLIVHSGEQLIRVESLELEGYKDSQLGRIISRFGHYPFHFLDAFSDMDYCIEIWNDKQDKKKKYNLSEVDYHIKNESYYDLSIYLKSADVRNIVLSYIENFLDCGNEPKASREVKKLPKIKDRVIDEEAKSIDFNRIAHLISKDLRGGYFKENGIEHWKGFGLRRLYEYAQRRLDIPDEVRKIILKRIKDVTSKYWDDYQNENIPDDELPDLDIRTVFADYTPTFEYKGYLEREKLFGHIAPFFNTRNRHDATDIGYLAMFISEASAALDKQLDLDQTVDHLVCDYFVQSIQRKVAGDDKL